jgi:hypothetical protein
MLAERELTEMDLPSFDDSLGPSFLTNPALDDASKWAMAFALAQTIVWGEPHAGMTAWICVGDETTVREILWAASDDGGTTLGVRAVTVEQARQRMLIAKQFEAAHSQPPKGRA